MTASTSRARQRTARAATSGAARGDIYNVNNGERFTTYAIRAERGTGTISVNGAAARKAATGDLLIIASYAMMNEIELQNFEPDLVYVDARNRITHHSRQIPAQAAA